MKPKLPPGRWPALSVRDFARSDIHYEITATGVVRATNTKHGARILVEVTVPRLTGIDRREFFVNLKSHTYVRLCEIFGDDLARWRGPFFVHTVRHVGDGRSRVEVP